VYQPQNAFGKSFFFGTVRDLIFSHHHVVIVTGVLSKYPQFVSYTIFLISSLKQRKGNACALKLSQLKILLSDILIEKYLALLLKLSG
jgi:hypothetical protein